MKTSSIWTPARAALLTLLALAAFAATQAKEPPPPPDAPHPEAMIKAPPDGAFLGVVPRPLDHVLRAALDYDEPGVLLGQVIHDSPAEKAGLVVGDILVKVNGKGIHDPERLLSLMRDLLPGDTVDLLLVHNGKSRTVKATLAPRPAPRIFSWSSEDGEALDLPQLLEMERSGIDADRHEVEVELEGLQKELEGLKVLQAEPGGQRKIKIIRREAEEPVYN